MLSARITRAWSTTASAILAERSIGWRKRSRRGIPAVRVRDLDSLNGTFVNGVPVKERVLEDGDQVQVGESVLLFLLDKGEAAAEPNPVQLHDQEPHMGSTIRLRREDAIYLQPGKIMEGLPKARRLARHLNALLEISTAVISIRDSAALQRRLLDLIVEVVPADQGAILLTGESAELEPVVGWDRHSKGPVQVDRAAANQVLREGVAILISDRQDGGVRSLLCVPIPIFNRVIGVVYLATGDRANPFDKEHLELVTAVAGLAGVALANARHVEWLETETGRLRAEIGFERTMVGESASMREIDRFIARVAPSDSTVLIRGESGTGKELAARAIHLRSPRAKKRFSAIDCATLSETLLESELFGYEKGAFTGAVGPKKGILEVASGGTVFLDEVGDLAPKLQAKLLRVLQEREFERVGGTQPIKIDIRLIAATNRDLREAVASGAFRQDLYYRLDVIALTMPPLRDRREDIELLAMYFTQKYARKCKRRVSGISAGSRRALVAYQWPGSVRELENAVERAIVLGSTEQILPEDLPEAVLEAEPAPDAPPTRYHEVLTATKKQLIRNALEQTGHKYTEAAKLLGVYPNYLHRLMRSLDLRSTARAD